MGVKKVQVLQLGIPGRSQALEADIVWGIPAREDFYSYHVLLYLINFVPICVTMRFRFYIKIFTPGRSFVLLSLNFLITLNIQNAFGAWRITGLVGVSIKYLFFQSIFSRFWKLYIVLEIRKKIHSDLFSILQFFDKTCGKISKCLLCP